MHSTKEADFKNALNAATRWLWLRANRGVMREVAEELNVSRPAVSQAYWGVHASRRITEALRKRGAPLAAPIDKRRGPHPRRTPRKS